MGNAVFPTIHIDETSRCLVDTKSICPHYGLSKALHSIVNLPRKSRHLDLTKEEVSDAESRAEENYSLQW